MRRSITYTRIVKASSNVILIIGGALGTVVSLDEYMSMLNIKKEGCRQSTILCFIKNCNKRAREVLDI